MKWKVRVKGPPHPLDSPINKTQNPYQNQILFIFLDRSRYKSLSWSHLYLTCNFFNLGSLLDFLKDGEGQSLKLPQLVDMAAQVSYSQAHWKKERKQLIIYHRSEHLSSVWVCRLQLEWRTSKGWTTSIVTCEQPTSSLETTWCARSPTSAWLDSSRTTSTQPDKVAWCHINCVRLRKRATLAQCCD